MIAIIFYETINYRTEAKRVSTLRILSASVAIIELSVNSE